MILLLYLINYSINLIRLHFFAFACYVENVKNIIHAVEC